MKNYNKDLCVFALLMLLGAGNVVFAHENITVNDAFQSDEVQEKIKANKDTLSKAQAAIDSKDFMSAINYLNGYIASKPGRYEAYKMRGDAYYALRRYDLAQNDYQTAVNIKAGEDKLSTNTKYVSAIILGADKNEQLQNVELGNLYAALMYAQKALNNPAYTASYENAVKYNSHIYLPQQNKADINKINCPQKYAKQLNPSGIDATIASAVSDIEKGDYHSSIFKIQNVISEYPKYYMGYYLMGVALVGLEKEDEAIKSFEKALALNPYDFESLASLGQIYFDKVETNFSQEDSQKSLEYFSKALELNKNCPTYHFYLGLNNLNSGNISSAIRNFDRALRINENDYNSMYYKAIAQYMNGDYNAVVNGTTKLLYKHVSNYNSVLYLRALAYAKLGQTEKATADLDALDENVTDVFNTDIKVTSKKDKVLEDYANYLRSQIAGTQNNLTRTNNGSSNPIIKKLSVVQTSLKPYENIINSKNISDEDYKKLENLYAVSLPKLLETGLVVTYDDIDTQYDFIRTTFSDLGVSFVQKSPDTYVMTTIKDYYKVYSPKMSAESMLSPASFIGADAIPLQGILTSADVKNTPTDKMLQAGESSLAQMLASNVLVKVAQDRSKAGTTTVPSAVTMTSSDVSKIEVKPQETVKPAPIVSSQEPYVPSNKQLVDDNNMKKVKDILEEEKTITEKLAPTVVTAKEIKPAQEFKIYNEPVNKPEESKYDVETSQGGNIKISAKEVKQTADVVVKNVPVTKPEVKTEEKTTQTKTITETPKREITKQAEKPKGNNPYVKQVYQGLSSAMAESSIGNSKDTVELSIPKDSSSSQSNIFGSDRLGFGIGAKAANSVFDSSLKSVQDKTEQLSTEASEKVVQPSESDVKNEKVAQTKDIVKEVEKTSKAAAKETPKSEATEIIVPKIKENGTNTQIKENLKDETVTLQEKTQPPAMSEQEQKMSSSLLEEYERLLKEKEKVEKQQKKEEMQLAKAQAQELKLQAKEEQKQILDEAKAAKLQVKEEQKQALEDVKAAKRHAKEEQKLAAQQLKEKAKEEKAEAKEKLQAARQQAKELKAAEEAKLSESKQGFVSKMKDKFRKAEKTPEEKTAELEAKAEKKAQALQLKQERTKAQIEAKERRAAQKAQEKLASEQKKAQEVTNETKQSFVSRIKDKFKKTEKTPQDKAAELQAKAEQKAKAQQLKEEKLKLKAEQKAKKAEEKSIEKARKELDNSVKKAQKEKEKTSQNVKKLAPKPSQNAEKKVNTKTKKSGTNNFVQKLKFWKKEKPKAKNSALGKYINNAVNNKKEEPLLRF